MTVLLGLAPAHSGAQRTSNAGSASVVGYVTSRVGREPLGFADASIDQFDIATFATREGTFQVAQHSGGDGLASRATTRLHACVVRLTLRRRAGGHGARRAGATRPSARTDPRNRRRLSRAWIGAGRYGDPCPPESAPRQRRPKQVARHESPFVAYMERTIGDAEVSRSTGAFQRANVMRVDTVPVPGEHEWRYEPGKLVAPTTAVESAAREKMIVPQLVDFADDAFMDNHCFRYAGLSNVDGARRIRLDFEPIKGLRTPDVRGSMYLDTVSYALTPYDASGRRAVADSPHGRNLRGYRGYVVSGDPPRAADHRSNLHAHARPIEHAVDASLTRCRGDASTRRFPFRSRAGGQRGLASGRKRRRASSVAESTSLMAVAGRGSAGER